MTKKKFKKYRGTCLLFSKEPNSDGEVFDPKGITFRTSEMPVTLNFKEEINLGVAKLSIKKNAIIADFPAKVSDNQILLSTDPGYLANLHSLPRVERERLLHGNWKIRDQAGEIFKREWFEIVDGHPIDLFTLRYWDLAGTDKKRKAAKKKGSKDPDYTVGLKIGFSARDEVFILDVFRDQLSPLGVERAIINTASADGVGTHIIVEEDPGQAGKFQIANLRSKLMAYKFGFNPPSESKIKRAKPMSAQSEHGIVKMLRAKWNGTFIDELENFPEGEHDDQVDALSGAFNTACRILGKIPGSKN